MNTTSPAENRLWVPLTVAGLALLVGVALLVYAFLAIGDSPFAGRPSQAAWRISVFPAGQKTQLEKSQRAALAAQAPNVRKLISDTYDALFLQPPTAGAVVRRNFAGSAASSFLRSRAGPPAGATDVRTTRRAAKVGLYARGASQAAAVVAIAARATLKGRPVAINHRATLWLERVGARWRVIGFTLRQGVK